MTKPKQGTEGEGLLHDPFDARLSFAPDRVLLQCGATQPHYSIMNSKDTGVSSSELQS